ncbi:MAG: tRNA (adenosine(37)-N6)-threonylcarbamoyltransferase complex transferase subunit TsaD [Elusimicrobia bacterium]|nr:tRNA (adenosine(37)-N6)-threonylcarbamoyltransferase complex transferase subunit TsaD [Elusimicrobiota bacterium]
MMILGIETSCDETSCALIKEGGRLVRQALFSQTELHQTFKGVVPEIASRSHLEKINELVEQMIQGNQKIDGIAVTIGPGLVGSLLIGKMTAEALGWVWDVPVVGINHLEAHLYSSFLEHKELKPPFMGAIVSGGHTHLVLVEDFGKYKVLGRTRDDSAGEAYDKVAKLLGLDYPGGPIIDRLAKKGDPTAIPFPRAHLPGSWDFSFSGLKTAVLYFLQNLTNKGGLKIESLPLPLKTVADICASFQSAVVDVLVRKTISAAKKFGLKKIAVGGGVSANSFLRSELIKKGKENKLKVYFPSLPYSTDNGAMVALTGYYKFKKGFYDAKNQEPLEVNPSLPIKNWN